MISTTNYLRGHLTVLALVGIACSRFEILSTLIFQLMLGTISFAVGLGITKSEGNDGEGNNGEGNNGAVIKGKGKRARR